MKIKHYFFAFILMLLANCSFTPVLHAQDGDSEDFLKKIDKNTYQLKDITIKTDEKTISFPCTINMASGLIEVALCTSMGKTHESLLLTGISPIEFQTALMLLGLDPVNELPEDSTLADPLSNFLTIETPGDSVIIFVEAEFAGKIKRVRIEDLIKDESGDGTLKPSTWLFRGAVTHRSGHVIIDPETTMIATYHDPLALMELNSESKFNDELYYVNDALKLTVGQDVLIIIQAIK
jgi:hypothetical protein